MSFLVSLKLHSWVNFNPVSILLTAQMIQSCINSPVTLNLCIKGLSTHRLWLLPKHPYTVVLVTTLPVTSCECDELGAISTLRLAKTSLWSTMSQDCVSGLAMLHHEYWSRLRGKRVCAVAPTLIWSCLLLFWILRCFRNVTRHARRKNTLCCLCLRSQKMQSQSITKHFWESMSPGLL